MVDRNQKIPIWYFKLPNADNIGDYSGRYIVEKLSQKNTCYVELTSRQEVYLTGGSILDQPLHRNCICWGSGCISSAKINLPKGVLLTAVRGPLTQNHLRLLGHHTPNAIGDPTLLLPYLYNPKKPDKKYKIGIIPHYIDQKDFIERSRHRVRSFKHDIVTLNIAHSNVEKFIDLVNSCEMIVSSSLHGVIIAQAYGIPALWVKFSDKVTGGSFKFHDYFLSVSIPPYDGFDFRMGNIDFDLFLKIHFEHATLSKIANFDPLPLIKSCPFIDENQKKDFSSKVYSSEYLSDHFSDAFNIRRTSEESVANFCDTPEDLRLLNELKEKVQALRSERDAQDTEIGRLHQAVAERAAQIESLTQTVAERDGQIDSLTRAMAERDRQIAALHNSTSWRITKPLRIVAHQVKRAKRVAELIRPAIDRGGAVKRTVKKAMHIYRSEGLAGIKRGFRAVAISSQAASDPGSLPATQVPEIPEVARAIDIDYSLNIPFTFTGSAPTDFASGQVAAIIHMFHEELASEFRSYLESIPPNFDIFISTTDTFRKGVIEKAFKGWSRGSIEVRIVPNRGRDIAPKLVNFRDVYDRYAYVLHLHSKSSHHASVLASWRHFLLENLLGTSGVVLSVLEAFHCNPKLGIIASQHFEPVRHWVNWGDNFKMADGLARRMGISLDQNAPLDFPSGSMFWARSAALQPLLELELQTEDFDEEDGRVDGTLAAAIERMYFHVCERAGYDWIKVARPELFEYTPAIMTVRNTSDLDDFFARYVFRLLNPGGVKPRTVHPPPVERPANQLLDYLRNRALGVEREDASTAKVAIGLLTYNNGGDELRLAVGAARLAVERSGLATKNSIFVLDNGASSEAITVGNAAVVRLASGGNIGYGAGHNRLMHAAFDAGADIYIAANPDGALHPDAVSSLVQTVQAHHGRALVEAVQFPVEVPKPYDPVTLATPWVSGVCLAIPRAAFKELCGFDESFFMYFGDVDLSWRARANGFALRTCPCAMFLHAVTNREQQPETLEMIFGAGITLARKWDSPDFEAWLRSELAALGAPVPDVRPAVVPEAWRRYADFSHHFSFAQARW